MVLSALDKMGKTKMGHIDLPPIVPQRNSCNKKGGAQGPLFLFLRFFLRQVCFDMQLAKLPVVYRRWRAHAVQQQRFSRAKIYCNSQRASRHLRSWCQVDEKSHSLLERAIDKLGLSARAYSRILKVARTIADLDDTDNIRSEYISEAVQYRSLDGQFRS